VIETLLDLGAAIARKQVLVGQNLHALERELGLPLLLRTSGGLQLTDEGTAVLNRTEAIKAQLVALDATVDAFTKRERGEVRVSAFPTAATSMFGRR
jgi:DNA-binding transcriptional LysR family regulator